MLHTSISNLLQKCPRKVSSLVNGFYSNDLEHDTRFVYQLQKLVFKIIGEDMEIVSLAPN